MFISKKTEMNKGLLITLFIIGGVVWGEVMSCDSCGRECTAACGTRQFRACCFNYLRKRGPLPANNDVEPASPPNLDPGLRLELWLARSQIRQTPHSHGAIPQLFDEDYRDETVSRNNNNNNNV